MVNGPNVILTVFQAVLHLHTQGPVPCSGQHAAMAYTTNERLCGECCFMHIQCRKHAILCINHMPDAWYACACAHEDGGQPTAMNNMHCCCAVGSRLRPPPVRTLCLLGVWVCAQLAASVASRQSMLLWWGTPPVEGKGRVDG